MSTGTGDALRAHDRVALGAGAGAVAWVSVLVVLNLTTQPLVSAASCIALAWLCIAVGHRRLIIIAALTGLGMCLVQPGIARVDGSFAFTYDGGAWQRPDDLLDWLRMLASTTRFPAQVLATVLLVLIPAQLLMAAAGRVSARGALLGGLAARLRPLLERDARLVRDELASRGVRTDASAPLAERVRGMVAVWDALVSGLVDRAFVTAAALRTRGYGVADRVTTEPLRDPRLIRGTRRRAGLDHVIVTLALAAMGVTAVGRALGQLGAPRFELFGGYDEPTSVAAVLVAALLVTGPVLLARAARTADPILEHATDLVGAAGTTAPVPVLARVGTDVHVDVADQPILLTLRDVSVHYPLATRPSLDRVTLDIRRGELVVLVGPSGSGKSTLLDALTGVAPIVTGGERSGEIRLADRVLVGHDSEAGLVAAVFQQPETQVIIGAVAEEVAFGLRQAGLPIDEIERRVVDTLERLGILHLARRDCATLSGGELQRVLLAAALAKHPDLLVLDEPTSQVDATSELRFWNAVDVARRERGIAVVVAEHRIEQLRHRADRIVGLVAGRCTDPDHAGMADRNLADLMPAPPRAGRARLSLRIDRLGVGDAHRVVARGVVADLTAGSIVTLEGPNGSGKSTLLRAVRGLHPVDGVVQVDGVVRHDVASSVAAFSWLSQAAGVMLPGRTVHDAVTTGRRRHARAQDAATVERLRGAGLGHRLDAHPSELSVGERQRLALVAATAHGAPIWLLDEPTRGMDPAARRWVALQVLAHAASGGVVLVATHDSELAAAVATHRLRLDVRTGPSLVQVLRDGSGRVVTPAATISARSVGEAAP